MKLVKDPKTFLSMSTVAHNYGLVPMRRHPCDPFLVEGSVESVEELHGVDVTVRVFNERRFERRLVLTHAVVLQRRTHRGSRRRVIDLRA